MRILIRKGDRYLRNDGEWVASQEEARAFSSSTEAVLFIHKYRLADAQAYLAFEDPAYDIALAPSVFQ